MDDERASLNYDCNYNLFLAKRLIKDIKRSRDRENAIKWLRLIMSSNKDITEMQLRNDFMYYLILNLQEACLRPPFANPPPTSGRLADLVDLIPRRADNAIDAEDSVADLSDTVHEKSVIMSKSPDGGAFLAMQPVPHHGSFCYLAISTKKTGN